MTIQWKGWVGNESISGMGKDDLYFVIGTLIALAGIVISVVGTDWQQVKGRLRLPKMSLRNWMVLACLVGSLVFSSVGWYKIKHRSLRFAPQDMELVYGKTFRNELVEVDGKNFDHCTFDHVTFLVHGTKPWAFSSIRFQSSSGPQNYFRLQSDNDSIRSFVTLYELLNKQPGANFVGGLTDSNGNVTPFNFQFNPDAVPPGQR